jgi:hypothetical protein
MLAVEAYKEESNFRWKKEKEKKEHLNSVQAKSGNTTNQILQIVFVCLNKLCFVL